MTPRPILYCGLLLGLIAATTNARADDLVDASSRIDAVIRLDLKKHELRPNPPVSDVQFVRRVYLDVIGRIPSDQELASFHADNRKDRRAKLIDALLDSPGHESHMFNWLGDMLRVKDDYYRIGKTWTFHTWLKEQLRQNRPWDELVHDLLTAEGRLGENGATAYLLRDANMPLDSLSNTLTTFLGANVACAQCHDHPFAEWTQRDFYEMASFFGSTAFERVDTRKPAITLRDERFSKANLVTLLQPNMDRVGGGAKAGFVYGKSDDDGYYVDENAVSVGAFHASIAFAAGMEIEKPATSPSGRPMTVGDGEEPIKELFA